VVEAGRLTVSSKALSNATGVCSDRANRPWWGYAVSGIERPQEDDLCGNGRGYGRSGGSVLRHH
jgi:hypothetical protein